jgi:dipeptidyl aminopeptidase/acylaminoacyl peptidase
MLGASGNSGIFSRAVEAPDVDATLRCVVSVSGPANLGRTDFSDQAQAFVDAWLEAKDASEHRRLARRASPVTYVDKDDPPFLLVHGTADPLVPMNQAELLADALRRAGVAVELHAVQGGGHGITSPEAYRRVAAFFDGHLGGTAAPVIEQIRLETDDDAP